MNDNKTLILKTLVGSQAHGLAGEDSDFDYRGVYVLPTSEILSLGFKYKGSDWFEGKEDQTTYEIGHFLHLALQCNPSILEVFKAPVVYEGYNTSLGYYIELIDLFKYIWNPKGAFNAFVGYGLNQRKKMLDNHLDRWNKYAMAYIRTLSNLCDLLETKDFSLEVKDPVLKIRLLDIKAKKLSTGEVIDLANYYENKAKELLPLCQNESQPEKVNNFLLKIRQEFWN